MSNYKLIKKIFIEGEIHTITGLHIGGTNNELAIGGMDNAVIRNPITQQPYIPGSSLKGKMRALLEISHGTIGTKPMGRDIPNPPTSNPRFLASRLFGYTQYDETKDQQAEKDQYPPQRPSRVIVRDCHLKNAEKLGANLTEVKSETVIDRITSAAMPRQLERVPPGAVFSMTMIVNIFEGDDEQELVTGILDGLTLIEDDYLGGAGSRGSGQVKFKIGKVTEKTASFYKEQQTEAPDVSSKYASNYPVLFQDVQNNVS